MFGAAPASRRGDRHLRRARRARRRPRRSAAVWRTLVPVARHPVARQGRPAENDATARIDRRPRHVRGAHRRRARRRAARAELADGAALLPVLSRMRPPPCSSLVDGRFPTGGHAHSAGVESAVAVGDVVDVADARARSCSVGCHHRAWSTPRSPRTRAAGWLRPRRPLRRSIIAASSTTSTPPACRRRTCADEPPPRPPAPPSGRADLAERSHRQADRDAGGGPTSRSRSARSSPRRAATRPTRSLVSFHHLDRGCHVGRPCACSASTRSSCAVVQAACGRYGDAWRAEARAMGDAGARRPAGERRVADRDPRRAPRHARRPAVRRLTQNPDQYRLDLHATARHPTTFVDHRHRNTPMTFEQRPIAGSRAARRHRRTRRERQDDARRCAVPAAARRAARSSSSPTTSSPSEDARRSARPAVLPVDRIVAVETGCCPHTAIRDDIAANLDAVEQLERAHGRRRRHARRERRRQPHRHLQPRPRRRADLRDRRRRRRQGAAQGRPRRHAGRPARDQQDRSRAPRPCRRRPDAARGRRIGGTVARSCDRRW